MRAALLALILLGCRDLAPTKSPESSPVAPPAAPTVRLEDSCAEACALAADDRPFSLARRRADTAGTSVLLARVRVGGEPGARITVALERAGDASKSREANVGLLLVRIGAVITGYSVGELSRGVTIHNFATRDTVTIEYRLLRGLSDEPINANRLVQHVGAGATVVEATRPWIRERSLQKYLSAGTGCIAGEPGLLCGDAESSVSMSPYYQQPVEGFSSTPCCGQTVALTITFTVPMAEVTIIAGDPDYAGNTITAFDAAGNVVDQQSYIGDNAPGELTYSTRTVAGDAIMSVRLDAPIGDYVYYLPIHVVIGGTAPGITSITPSPMVPGTAATIKGLNFGSTVASNTVMIGGQQATVMSATSKQLVVTVPCTASGSVNVTVAAGGQTTPVFAHPLQVPKQDLQIGQAVVLPTSVASACNEFPVAAGGTARYVMSVVNVDSRPTTSASVQVSADLFGIPSPSNGWSRAASATRQRVTQNPLRSRPLSVNQLAEQQLEARREADHSEFLKQNAREYERLRTRFGGVGGASLAVSPPTGPAPPPLTRTIRVIDMAKPVSCNRFYMSNATRVYYSGKVAIYEDDATPTAFKAASNATMASYYSQIGNQFNADMEPIIIGNFGDMLRRDAVMDKNGVVVLLFTPRIAQSGSTSVGVTSGCDQLPNDDKKSRTVGGPYTGTGANGASNFGEVLYITLPTVVGTGYGGNTPDEWYRNIRSTVIHESKHLASHAARSANSYPFEADWLEEGTARIAEELWMRITVDKVGWKAGTGFGSATQPVNVFCDLQTVAPCASGVRPARIMSRHFGTMLIALQNPGQYSAFGSAFAGQSPVFYSEAWALVRYSIDRYATAENVFLKALNAARDTGVRNLELRSGAGITIGQLLGGRALSMFADQYPGLSGASVDIAFPTWNLRDIYTWFNGSSASSTALPYPLVPTQLTFGGMITTPVVALPGGSTLWYELSGTQLAPQLVRLEGSGGATLGTTIRLAIARLQ